MIDLKKTFLIAMFAGSTGVSYAMNLADCYRAALDQDATYKAALASAEAGRETLPQARAQLLPNISASFSQNRNQLSSTSPDYLGRSVTTDLNYPSHGETLTLRQPLFRKSLWDGYQQAKFAVEDVDATLAVEQQNLAVRVGSAYFDALLAEDQHALVKAQLASYSFQLEAAQKMFAAGSGTRTDIDDVQARLDMTVALELEARQNVSFTRRQLQNMVNRSVDSLTTVDASKLALLPPEPDRLDYWIDRAESSSPEIRVLRARLESSKLDVEKAKSGHVPTLDAIAQWSRSASENTQNTQSTTDLRSIGVQLIIPIYAGGGVSSSVRQALAVKDRVEQVLEATRRELGLRVQKEFRGVTEGILKVKAQEQSVLSTNQAVQSSQKSFQAGARTRIDILNAENNSMLSQRDLTQARHSYLLSNLRLHALVGDAGVNTIELMNSYLR